MCHRRSAIRNCLVGACLGLIMLAVGMANPLRVVYFENYEPISWMDAGTVHGVLVDNVDEAISRGVGIAVEHSGYPWARAQEMAKQGLADSFLTVATPERAEYTNASEESVLSLDSVAYTGIRHPRRVELERVQTLDDLQQYTLADGVSGNLKRVRIRIVSTQFRSTQQRKIQCSVPANGLCFLGTSRCHLRESASLRWAAWSPTTGRSGPHNVTCLLSPLRKTDSNCWPQQGQECVFQCWTRCTWPDAGCRQRGSTFARPDASHCLASFRPGRLPRSVSAAETEIEQE